MERPKVGSEPPAEQNGQAKDEVAQSVKDALADAETLRLVAQEITRNGIRTRLEAASFNHRYYFDSRAACLCGCGAGTPMHLAWEAARCANQAFRAVPGLREPRS